MCDAPGIAAVVRPRAYDAPMTEDTLLPDIPLPRRRWEVTVTVPHRGGSEPLAGIPSGDGIVCALTAAQTVFSVLVDAVQMPEAAMRGLAAAGDWARMPGAVAEVHPVPAR